MPEGPSIVLLKEEAQIFEGRKILQVSGNSKEAIQRLQGVTIKSFKTWGKHFLICCPDFTLRIHLMLFGSYLINETKAASPRLSLTFNNGYINFYTCSLKFIEGDLNAVYDWSADIMHKAWNEKNALAKLKARPGSLLCDVLLDQDIFAGSGNIIKNEVMYRLQLHPLNTISELPQKALAQLVKATPEYAFDFLRWKKAGSLKKHWLAHTQSTCSRCDLPMQKAYLGKTKRRTYYCDNCQKLY
ncbi:MAG: endonuclease [Bacteroidetes bacterium 43-16]|nr:MAG: endonuclease [Bacteroidetes bacterium 43-16]